MAWGRAQVALGAMAFSLSATGGAVGITSSERRVATWLGESVAGGFAATGLVWAWAGAGFCLSRLSAWGQVALGSMAFSLLATASAVGITLSERKVATWLGEPVAVGFAGAGLLSLGRSRVLLKRLTGLGPSGFRGDGLFLVGNWKCACSWDNLIRKGSDRLAG